MVSLGLDEEETLIAEHKAKRDARLQAASTIPEIDTAVMLEMAKMRGQVNRLTEMVNNGLTTDQVSSPIYAAKRKGNKKSPEKDEQALPGEASEPPKQVPGDTIRLLEAPQEAKPSETTDEKGERRADTSKKPV
jgi:hypothetical protein